MQFTLALRAPLIIADPSESPAIAYALEELRGYLSGSGQHLPEMYEAWDDAIIASSYSVLVIGRRSIDAAAARVSRIAPITDERPGPGGIVLQALRWEGKTLVVAGGSDAAGTLQALVEVLKAIDWDDGVPSVPLALDRCERPRFRWRGMYAHTAWIYHYPYALRAWREEDWMHYVDILYYLNINLFMLWIPAGLMPLPHSEADRAILEMFRDVIAHAREHRGMTVWVIECPNNYLSERVDAPFEQREYWRYYVEQLKNPGDPGQSQQILASRAAFYRIVNNADGYALIDGDPGGWPGSPSKGLVQLFIANRALLDELTVLGRRTTLIYWTWWGWGTESREGNWEAVYRGLMDRVAEPWEIIVCYPEHMRLAARLGLLSKAMVLPYGAIEGEPSSPLTMISRDRLAQGIEMALQNPDVRGVMGNAQTPLVQLPNIAILARLLWDAAGRDEAADEALRSLGRLIYPDQAELLAHSWALLAGGEARLIFDAADRLDVAIQGGALGRLGIIGRSLFPTADLIARDLVLLLQMRGYAELFKERWNAGADEEILTACLVDYCRHNLRWQMRHGYQKVVGSYADRRADRYAPGRGTYGPYVQPLADAWRAHSHRLGWTADDLADKITAIKDHLREPGEFPVAWINGLVEDILGPYAS